ncbi:MAG: hypothetical protein FH752_17315 [Marinobacter adhaerens]|uniref:Uncharacterized protein n=1 Tax=Marinobacter adhaerens TaxID=1033846 RepID=A0A844I1Y1_9GAMM|nr:hypothetical protein [Marinobacter adhaerens]
MANWISLKLCPECGTLWCFVPYEPYASFSFLVKWPYDEKCFGSIAEIGDARVLHEWHGAFLRENWRSLVTDEIEAIDRWRQCTYMSHNPIDKDLAEYPNKYLSSASEIVRYAENTFNKSL